MRRVEAAAPARLAPPPPSPSLVELDRVGFSYRGAGRRGRGPGIHLLSLRVGEGEVLGLAGPNGAGKTTTIKLLAGLLLPHEGTVRLDGRPVGTRRLRNLRAAIGFAPCGERGLYPRLTAADNLRLFAALQGLRARAARRRIDEVLDALALGQVRGQAVERLSRGMRQRLHIARAILHEPRVLLVDEPTLGLDPESSRGVRLLLNSLAVTGTAIVLATNYLPEAADLCSRLVVLHGGVGLFDGPPARLLDGCRGRQVLELLVPAPVPEERLALLGPASRGARVLRRGGLSLVEIVGDEASTASAARVASALGAPPPLWHATRAPTLEDAYLLLTQGRRGPAGGVDAR